MKKLVMIAAVMAATSFNALSHSQNQDEIKEIVYSQRPTIQIQFGNLNSIPYIYDIEVNGIMTGQTVKLQAREQKKAYIRLPNIQPDIKVALEVCTIARSPKAGIPRTRMCTPVKVYFPKSQLIKAKEG